MRTLALRSASAIAAALVALAAVLIAPAAPARAADHDPVVFVHGWQGSAANWDTMISRLRADGWSAEELHAWDYDSSQSNRTTAEELAAEVDRVLAATGAAEVDIVTHSMGGLSSRHYLKFLGGTGHVDDWVSLGGPNHGTSSAYWCFQTSCFEMRPGSSFLSDLNAGDETPPGADYGTFWSNCDAIINPDDSVVLSGAANENVGCVSHTGLLSDTAVYQGVRDFIR